MRRNELSSEPTAAEYFYLWIRFYIFFFEFACQWLIIFIVHHDHGLWMSNRLDVKGLLDPIFQFFSSFCQGNFRTIWAQDRSSQPLGAASSSPVATCHSFLRSPVLITIISQFNASSSSWIVRTAWNSISRRLLHPMIQHPKIEVTNVFHGGKKTNADGRYYFFFLSW